MRQFGPFETRPVVALAISGGRDSRALALLAGAWVARRGGKAVALVVDHGLRAQSPAEAEQTRAWSVARGIETHVLRWRPAVRPATAIQAKARAARYRLLLDWCRDNGVLHLLTAHQADDQAETYVLRMAHDSGATGLAGMSAVVEFAEARLLRPLLSLPRARLTATMQAKGQGWIDDPSNLDPRFGRGRLRRHGLPVDGTAALRRVARFAARRVADEHEAAMAVAASAMPHPLGAVLIDHADWLALPTGRAEGVLAAAVAMAAGADYPPRRDRAKRVMGRMRAVSRQPAGPPAGHTLGGCRILWRGGAWMVVREPASISADQPAPERSLWRWDGRFEICAKGREKHGLCPVVAAGTGAAPVPAEWRRAWPATSGLPALAAAMPRSGDGGMLPAAAIEGGMASALAPGMAGPNPVSACFRPGRPLVPGPFFPCFADAKGQIVNR